MARDIKQQWVRLKSILEGAGLSQSTVSDAAQVDQATVSRVLSHCPKRAGKAFRRLCKYADTVDTKAIRPDPSGSHELMSALGNVWDGSDEHAEALAAIIQAVGLATKFGKY